MTKNVKIFVAFFESKPVIIIFGLLSIAFIAIDSYYNYYTYSVLSNDINGTIAVDGRTTNGISHRYLLNINNGNLRKVEELSDAERMKYPAPRTLNIATDKSLSHDGKRIAFYKQGKIFVSDTLRNNTIEVIGGHFIVTPMEEATIAWSPNDKYLAFVGRTIGGQIWPTYNLYIVPIDKKNNFKTVCYNIDYIFYWK